MVANPKPSDHDILAELNAGYIRSVQHSDVAWFDTHLTPDFLNSNPDGTLVDRVGFLAQIAKPVTIRNLAVEDVRIRIIGDTALIHARTTYAKPDGSAGGSPEAPKYTASAGRYTDIWMKQRDGKWLCVAAHVTRA